MAFLYVREQRGVVRKRGERLVVEVEGERLLEAPLRDVTAVAVFGGVQITTQALSELCDRRIPVGLFTRNGRLKGRVVPEGAEHGALRMEQYRRAQSVEESLKVAHVLVEAKLANSAALIEAHRSNHPSGRLAGAQARLEELARDCVGAADHAALMGMEGTGAAAYFEAFGEMNRSGLEFGRRGRPACDPLNALLNLSYTLVYAEMSGYVECLGMDAQLGFLHSPAAGRASLALDLMEPFRAPLADRFVLELVNRRGVDGEDFVWQEGRGIRQVVLLPEALRRVLGRWEEFLLEKRGSAPEGLRGRMGEAAESMAGHLRKGGALWVYREG